MTENPSSTAAALVATSRAPATAQATSLVLARDPALQLRAQLFRSSRRLVAAIYVLGGAALVNVATGAALAWVIAHPYIATMIGVFYCALEVVAHAAVDSRIQRRLEKEQAERLSQHEKDEAERLEQLRYSTSVVPGAPGPPELTALLRVAHAFLESISRSPVEKARIRVTLFIPDEDAGLLFQVARWRWDGLSVLTGTTVKMGTCAAGHAWNTRDEYRLVVSTELGFTKSLRGCGVSEKDAEAHRLRDRTLFLSVPVFRDPTDQTPYRRGPMPEEEAIGAFVVDAADESALPADWAAQLARFVFPGLVTAMQTCPRTQHLFARE